MLHCVELLSLQQFDTEHSFLKKIRFAAKYIEKYLIILMEYLCHFYFEQTAVNNVKIIEIY